MLGFAACAASACGDDDDVIIDGGDYDAGLVDAGDDDAGGEALRDFGGLIVDTPFVEHDFDLFGVAGHRIWLEVSGEQLELMNDESGGGIIFALEQGPTDLARVAAADLAAFGPVDEGGDIYTPEIPGSDVSFADHLVLEDFATQRVADYGKVEIALVGESTFRQWSKRKIPNVRIDADELEMGKRIGGFEHLRLNNSLVGSIFREHIAHRIYRELDYPALRSTFAFLGSNVWGDDVWVPMTLIEMYKKKLCKTNEDVGGECVNMWEFPGDLYDGGGVDGPPGFPIDFAGDEPLPRPRPGGDDEGPRVPEAWCQVSECDNTRLVELMDTLAAAPQGAGFKDALADYVDWERYHQFQCLSWILWTGDDPIHNANNNLIMERDDGKFLWAPYSVDISAGQDWYTNVTLTGTTSIARGCQLDPECWADTIATCEDLIVRFDDLNPETFVDEAVTTLSDRGMMRFGDDERAEQLRQWYVWRQSVLAGELEIFRYLPDASGNCPMELVLCADGGCGTPTQCELRSCPFGQTQCESLGRCVDLNWEECPSCEAESPVYCEWSMSCVADMDTCHASCDARDGYVWCLDFGSCTPELDCPSGGGGGEDDGGVLFSVEP